MVFGGLAKERIQLNEDTVWNGKKRDRGNALFKRRKFCRFTAEKIKEVDYKDIAILKDFINENGKIIPMGVKPGNKVLIKINTVIPVPAIQAIS